MQIIQIEDRVFAEFHSRDFIGWRPRAGMVPGTDDRENVLRAIPQKHSRCGRR